MNLHQRRPQFRNRLGTAVPSRRARLGLEPLEDRCVPAIFSVNSLADVLNPGPGIVTLRSAIQQANATPGGNTIDLTVPGTYKITLPGTPGETDNAAGEFAILPSGGDLTIANTSGGPVVIDGNHQSRVFDINPNFDPANPTPKFLVTLTGLTVANGFASDAANPDGPNASGGGIRDNGNASLTLNEVTVTDGSATADGGGIVFENTVSTPWTLTVNDSVISDNHAGDAGGGIDTDGSGKIFINAGTVLAGNTCLNQGAGIWLDAIQAGNVFQTANLTITGAIVRNNAAQAGLGGGIGNAGNGVVTITGSTIADNSTGATGGGFGDENAQGTLIVQGSLFQGNAAVGNGGGIASGGPSTTINSSEIKGNSTGGNGGGLFANGATLNVADSTIAGNVSAANGGGAEIETTGTGAAGSAISFTTISANAALNNGGGNIGGGVDIGNGGTFSGALQLTNDTINANYAVSGGGLAMASGGTVAVQNTIIAGNHAIGSGVDYLNTNGTHFTSQGGNLVGNNNNGDTTFNQATDRTGTGANPLDPLLGPLQNNGGPTVGAAGASLVLETQALLTGSPAIGKGVAAGAPGVDERGFPFAANAPLDVGAFQSGALPAASLINLVASVSAPVAGQSLTFTATVAAQQAGSNQGTPIGTVVFTVDGAPAGSFPLDGAGAATLVLPAGLLAGSHSVAAAYQGGGSYAASSTTLAVPVGQAGSTTQVAASATSVALGQPLTLTATVAAVAPGNAAATGIVNFFDGGTLLGSVPLLNGGQAVFTTTSLGVGPHMLTATFGGNGNLTGSTATAAAVTVTRGTPTVSLVTTSRTVRPGQSITLIAVVSGPAGAASGTVTFLDNGTPVDTTLLNHGVADFTTTRLHGGNNVFTVTYGGDATYQAASTNTGVDVVVVTRRRSRGGQNHGRATRLTVLQGRGHGEAGPGLGSRLDRVLRWGRHRS